ncbi:acyl-CoA dehydrogenase family protein [soil metagenome]|jgi:alkylation response protein AidB-like acyl-CoA dehydrogenase
MTPPAGEGMTARLRTLAAGMLAELAVPATGATGRRHAALAQLARIEPVDLARLAEAHADALAIMAEAGCAPVPASTYGVWAASGPNASLHVDADRTLLTGLKPFCSGLQIVDRALVTALDSSDRQILVDVALRDGPTISTQLDHWASPALRDTNTGQVQFDGHPFTPDRVIGDPGFYLDRPGFWHGAMGPAACWAGGALGLVDAAEKLTGSDPHRLSHLGSMRSAAWTMQAVLRQAGDEIDRHPTDGVAAQYRARAARHMIERLCTGVLDHFSRSLGPRPFVSDAAVAKRYADVHLYLRQDHAERDLEHLGTLPPPPSHL